MRFRVRSFADPEHGRVRGWSPQVCAGTSAGRVWERRRVRCESSGSPDWREMDELDLEWRSWTGCGD